MPNELSMYEAQVKKMQDLCEEHDLTYRFSKDEYPVRFTIRLADGFDAQLSMLENAETDGYQSPDARMTWIYEDGALSVKVTGGTFTIGVTLRKKIETILLKMIGFWQAFFFRDVIERKLLSPKALPTAEDDDKAPMPEGAEPLEELVDEDGNELATDEAEDADDRGNPTMDDPEIAEAARIVRMANSASASLLQRHMKIGYSKAARLLDDLEDLGVVGPFNGSQPREVLGYDVPDEEASTDEV